MKTAHLVARLVVLGTVIGFSTSARADDEIATKTPSHGKPGLVATGVVLTVFGAGHLVVGGILAAHLDGCGNGSWMICPSTMQPVLAPLSFAVGATLLAVGIPLIAYGSTAKVDKPHAQLGVSPNGFSFSGTF